MTHPAPRVSIGIPVYNGENYLAETIDAILDQTFTDFELVIADNASTDRTEEICRSYAENDPRIRYHRQRKNLGAAPNYNDVFRRSRASYFMWMAHDDLILRTYLERCVSALDERPDCVVAYAMFRFIDGQGRAIGAGEPRPGLASPDVAERIRHAIHAYRNGGASDAVVFGLMRRSALMDTSLHGSYTGSDRTLLMELALLGPFYEIPEQLFLNRDHAGRSVRRKVERWGHGREAWFDTSRQGRIVFPNWRRLGSFTAATLRSPVGARNKARCLRVIATWVREGNWKRLVNDLYIGFAMALRRNRTAP